MRKVLFIFFIVFVGLLFAYIVDYDGLLVIQVSNYEIKTSLKNVFFILLLILVVYIFLTQTVFLLLKTNLTKYDKKLNKIKANYENYISFVEVAYYELLSNNISTANKYLQKADAFIPKRQLTTLIGIASNVVSKDYSKSLQLLKNINDKKSYIQDAILLREYIDGGNTALIQETAERLLLSKKYDQLAVVNLYKIYKNNSNWSKCGELLKIIKEQKYFSKDELKIETQLVNYNKKSNQYKSSILHNFISKIKNIFRFNKMSA